MKQNVFLAKKAGRTQIFALYSGATMIILSGAALAVYSVANQISYQVMGNEIHGAVFGSIIAFLGIRYFFSVQNLHRQIDATGEQFSWRNITAKK